VGGRAWCLLPTPAPSPARLQPRGAAPGVLPPTTPPPPPPPLLLTAVTAATAAIVYLAANMDDCQCLALVPSKVANGDMGRLVSHAVVHGSVVRAWSLLLRAAMCQCVRQ